MACELIKAQPQASLRQIAKQAGISPATVADVRDRMRRGVDPVPPKQRGVAPAEASPRRTVTAVRRNGRPKSLPELMSISKSLQRDPSLRLNEGGRVVLRMLDACAAVERERQRILAHVPAHCKGPMSELVHGYAEMWKSFAEELQEGGAPAGRSL